MKTAPTDEQTECSDRCRLATEASVKYAALAGRQLFSMIFIISSAGHFSPQTVVWAASHHVPLSEFLVPLSGLMALAGGLSVLLGFHTRFGAWLLVSFLLPVTMMMHNFWAVAYPAISQIEKSDVHQERRDVGRCPLHQLFRRRPVEPGRVHEIRIYGKRKTSQLGAFDTDWFIVKQELFLFEQRRRRRAWPT